MNGKHAISNAKQVLKKTGYLWGINPNYESTRDVAIEEFYGKSQDKIDVKTLLEIVKEIIGDNNAVQSIYLIEICRDNDETSINLSFKTGFKTSEE